MEKNDISFWVGGVEGGVVLPVQSVAELLKQLNSNQGVSIQSEFRSYRNLRECCV